MLMHAIVRCMSRSLGLMAVLALAGCGTGDSQSGPGEVSMDEARSLDEAAAMIEEGRPPPEEQPAQPKGVSQ